MRSELNSCIRKPEPSWTSGGRIPRSSPFLETGKVFKFEMNDRCAAGTGQVPGIHGHRSPGSAGIVRGFCAPVRPPDSDKQHVHRFCRKRGHLSYGQGRTSGKHRHGAARGNRSAHHRDAERGSVYPLPLVFAGGVAHNPCVVRLFEEELGHPVIVPENPDMVGAIGAALYGKNGVVRI